jgi:hypothetical protein
MKLNYIKLILMVICAGFLTGCASPATVQGMRSQTLALQNRHPFSVNVQVTGGRNTNPLWTSEISDDAFIQAIRESISESGSFRSVVTTGSGDYLLEVIIVNVDKPLIGLDMTVNMTANWKLTHVPSNKIVYQQLIPQRYTATFGDSIVGIKRLRLAEEGAARGNIVEGLTQLSRLNLQGNE